MRERFRVGDVISRTSMRAENDTYALVPRTTFWLVVGIDVSLDKPRVVRDHVTEARYGGEMRIAA